MRGGVTEPVRVRVVDPGLLGANLEPVSTPSWVMPPRCASHHASRLGVLVRRAGLSVAVQRATGLGAERDDADLAALADHADHVVLFQIDVGHGESGELGDPQAAVEQHAQHGVVASVDEVGAVGDLQQSPDLVVGQHVDRVRSRLGLLEVGHRVDGDVALRDRPTHEAAHALVPGEHRLRLQPGFRQVPEPRADGSFRQLVRRQRPSLIGQPPSLERDGLGVDRDGPRGLAGAQVALPRGEHLLQSLSHGERVTRRVSGVRPGYGAGVSSFALVTALARLGCTLGGSPGIFG